jgi:ribonucleotide monophosphatase NagD (HAD superfamily)
MGPGALAKRYAEMGGMAHMIGKPHKLIFKHAMKLFDKVIPSRVCVIGDSFQHDIMGANASDLDSVFITQGVHGAAFKADMTAEQKRKAVEQMVHNYGVRPKWVMDSLVWQTKEGASRQRERERFKD